MLKLTENFLADVVKISQRAGDDIMEIHRSGALGVTYKEDDSPLTRADQKSHDRIVEELGGLVPKLPVLSEESSPLDHENRRSWDAFWLVDPLDGTKEFTQGLGEFAVNIALIQRGEPVLGVVHAPALGVTYGAAAGLGAVKITCAGKIRIHAADYRQGNLTVVVSRSHAGEKIKQWLAAVRPEKTVSMGSGLKMCLVAEGAAHVYPRLGPTMEWDTAAAHCVVVEAGGHVTDLSGQALCYNKPHLENPQFIVCGDPPYPWQETVQFLR